jgi:hypothetical protein
MSKKKTYTTIKEAAEDLLMQVSYVDVYRRKVGLTYNAILIELHKLFPNSRTSLRSLRMIKCNLNRTNHLLPARRRSSKVLARDYARALLVEIDLTDLSHPQGYSFKRIARMVKRKFPEYDSLSAGQMMGLSLYLSKHFKLPPRPED